MWGGVGCCLLFSVPMSLPLSTQGPSSGSLRAHFWEMWGPAGRLGSLLLSWVGLDFTCFQKLLASPVFLFRFCSAAWPFFSLSYCCLMVYFLGFAKSVFEFPQFWCCCLFSLSLREKYVHFAVCDIVIYRKKYISSSSMIPGPELLKPLEFPMMRNIKVSCVMLMR